MLGVLNKGIGGNRLLRNPGQPPLIGINEIGHPSTGTIPVSQAPTLDDMIAG